MAVNGFGRSWNSYENECDPAVHRAIPGTILRPVPPRRHLVAAGSCPPRCRSISFAFAIRRPFVISTCFAVAALDCGVSGECRVGVVCVFGVAVSRGQRSCPFVGGTMADGETMDDV